MSEKRYIHIRNWDAFQHPDITRNRRAAVPWIKDATAQLSDEDFVELTFADRGVLQSLRLQYAANRGRGINDSTASLQRLFGHRVMRTQLERLNEAGFIVFSASKSLADPLASCGENGSLEVEVEVEEEKPTPPPTVPSYVPKTLDDARPDTVPNGGGRELNIWIDDQPDPDRKRLALERALKHGGLA